MVLGIGKKKEPETLVDEVKDGVKEATTEAPADFSDMGLDPKAPESTVCHEFTLSFTAQDDEQKQFLLAIERELIRKNWGKQIGSFSMTRCT